MSKLTLHFLKNNLGTDISHGVVARIQGYRAGGSQSDEPYYRELVIPASRGSGLDVEVDPGRYRVQAILPTGEILQEERQVRAGERHSIVFADHSAREWLSWQRFDGASPKKSSLEIPQPSRPPTLPPLPLSTRRSFRRLLKNLFGQGSADDDHPEVFPDIWRGVRNEAALTICEQPRDTGTVLWTRAARAAQAIDFVGGWQGISPAGAIRALRLEQEVNVSLWQVIKDSEETLESSTDAPMRYWAVSDVADVVETGSIPLPWSDDFNSSAVEILVDSADGDIDRRTSMIVRDSVLGGMLAYLGRGRLANARPLVASLDKGGLIERTIEGKRRNPLAACAAAYVGLAIFEPGERERWDSWLPNLMNWFPWLPDGAIVHARRIIQRPRHSAETDDALAALKRAYRCGIPYFTAGVLHLRDSLLMFSAKDQEAREMLETVSRVASRVDTDQAFTLLRFPKV